MSEVTHRVRISAEAAVAANTTDWMTLRAEYEKLFGTRDIPVVYGLPESLIEALDKQASGLLSNTELDFELRVHDLLRDLYAVGLADGRPIHSSLFEQRAAVSISPAEFDALGWHEYGLTCEQVNQAAVKIESRSLPFHEQLVAYAGWLVTNPQFLQELAALREREPPFIAAASNEDAGAVVREMNAFLGRWQLTRMSSWDLPEPQGPNLSGVALPAAARRGAASVSLELPLTTRLPARFPIRDLISEIRSQDGGSHLAGWQDVLSTEKNRGPGVKGYASILHIRFFRDIVLASRYAGRFEGHVEALDRAFGAYLGVGQQSVRKLRLEIAPRLRGPAIAGHTDR